MHPKSTHTFTSHIALAPALAAGLSFAPLADAKAQHSGHHGHHEGHGATKAPVKKKAPPKKRGSGHGQHGAATSGAVPEYQVAHHKMMRNMAVPYTGDPDVDFRVQMIPHHQGAIDMARTQLEFGTDPDMRKLAEDVIAAQEKEIAFMEAWLAKQPK